MLRHQAAQVGLKKLFPCKLSLFLQRGRGQNLPKSSVLQNWLLSTSVGAAGLWHSLDWSAAGSRTESCSLGRTAKS